MSRRKNIVFQAIIIVMVAAGSCSLYSCSEGDQSKLPQSVGIEIDSATSFLYYPALHKLELRIDEMPASSQVQTHKMEARLYLKGDDKVIAKGDFTLTAKKDDYTMELPKLADGDYEVKLTVSGSDYNFGRSFHHKNFAWLGNHLGESDAVHSPFEPITLSGKDVNLVLRKYTMNGFGLWNQVNSEGIDLLAAPIVLHLLTDQGEETWKFLEGKWVSQAGNKVEYQSTAESETVKVNTSSIIEYDGCMKVAMKLTPGSSGRSIKRMWIDIPIKDAEAPLFHYVTVPDVRRNYAGATPHGGKITWMNEKYDTDPPKWPSGALPPVWKAEPGSNDGKVWSCRDIRPWQHVFKTDFVPYIWLGGGTRGISWFGDSPKGYKLDSAGVVQKIERSAGVLSLQIDLINKPGPLSSERNIVFGLQASPTKPMPKNWRANIAVPSLPIGDMVCWGGHECADKYPDDGDFKVVDEIIKVRKTGVLDSNVFKQLDQNRSRHFQVMGTHNLTASWLDWVMDAARINQAFHKEGTSASDGVIMGAAMAPYRYHVDGADPHGKPSERTNPVWTTAPHTQLYPDFVAEKIADAPLPVYFEEHASNILNEEWVVYQDEWRGKRVSRERSQMMDINEVENNFKVGRQGVPGSYRDFCLWYANEWMKRGVSIYIDNMFPNVLDNPLTSDAFIDDDGDLQPAAAIWDMREYHKRLWTLEQEWNNRNPPYKIMITHHMTNVVALPINTWNDAMLDLEWWTEGGMRYGRKKNGTTELSPFSPELLLAEATGHQTGSYRHVLTSILSVPREVWFKSPPAPEFTRPEWGMRMVHETFRWLFPYENYAAFEPARSLEKSIWDFGYSTDDCSVVNYWENNPPVKVSDPDVKWLLLSRKKDNKVLLVLQSYLKKDARIDVKLDDQRFKFNGQVSVHDVESRTTFNGKNDNGVQLSVPMNRPFDTKVLIIEEKN